MRRRSETVQKIVEFPKPEELWERTIRKKIDAADYSEFLRSELKDRVIAALRPLAGIRVVVELPEELRELTPSQHDALDATVKSACEQYWTLFGGALARSAAAHCTLIEDLRKKGVSVQRRDSP
jgi:hypothetical protein